MQMRLVSFLSLALVPLSSSSLAQTSSVPPCASPAAKAGYCSFLQEAMSAAADKKNADQNLARSPVDPTLKAADDKAADQVKFKIKHLLEPGSTDVFITAYGQSLATLLASSLMSPNSAFNQAVDAWEKQRLDVQTGSNPASAGSTNLVVQSGVAALLSAAYQSGALSQTTTGNTVTFDTNVGRILKAIAHQSPISTASTTTHRKQPQQLTTLSKKETNNHHLDLDHLEISVGVDLNQEGNRKVATSGPASSTTPDPGNVLLPSAGSKISSVTVRYGVAAPFDPGSENFQAAFATAYAHKKASLQQAGAQLATVLEQALGSITKDKYQSIYDQYQPVFTKDINDGDGAKLEDDFQEYFNAFVMIAQKNANFDSKMAGARIFLQSYQDIVNEVTDKARGGSPFTLEYDYSRPANQPDTHVARAIFAHQYGAAMLTCNGAATIYGGTISAATKYQRLRDFQFSAGFDTPVGDPNTSIFAFSAAAYAQYQFDPSVLNITSGNLVPGTSITLPANAQVLLGKSGLLAIAQGKLTINTKSGIKIPLAVKWSNKTELLDSNDVRGQFGVSYDFSSFSSLLGAKTPRD